jgi:hypothetical protein
VWQELKRAAKYPVKTKPRPRPKNVKQQVVEDREFKDIRLAKESVAEFRYRPTACSNEYRVVVLLKEMEVHQGQQFLFDDMKCFFFITNDFEKSAEEIVFEAIPAQVVKTGRRILLRFLAWNQWLPAFFRLLDQLRTPLRC